MSLRKKIALSAALGLGTMYVTGYPEVRVSANLLQLLPIYSIFRTVLNADEISSASAIAMVKCAQIGGLRDQTDLTCEFYRPFSFMIPELIKDRFYCPLSYMDEVRYHPPENYKNHSNSQFQCGSQYRRCRSVHAYPQTRPRHDSRQIKIDDNQQPEVQLSLIQSRQGIPESRYR